MLTFYDAFHGVGGFRRGLEEAGMVCVGGCEIDKYACQAYGVINNEECSPTDIRTVDPIRLPDFDTFVFGWPCQDNSIAGKRKGQQPGTRSGLLYEAARILRVKKPRYFIAENVEGLFSVNDGIDFYATIRLFTDLGYDCQWQLLNTRWFLPQNRERIFFVGHLRGEPRPEIFPITEKLEMDAEQLEPAREGREPLRTTRAIRSAIRNNPVLIALSHDKLIQQQTVNCLDANYAKGLDKHGQRTGVMVAGHLESDSGQTGLIYDPSGIAPTQLKQHGNAVTKIIDVESGLLHSRGFETRKDGVSHCVKGAEGGSSKNMLLDKETHRIRKLTPLECFRLQGYPDWWIDKCREAGISDSQLYKMAGNGVSVPPVREIGKRLIASWGKGR